MSRRRWIVSAALGAPSLVGLETCWIEPQWVRARTIRLGAAKTRNRLIHITDIHYKGDRDYLETVVKVVNDLKPDLVCFTGDLIEKESFVSEALEILGQLRCPVYGVPGNHDHASRMSMQPCRTAFAKTGGAWLMNEDAFALDGTVHIMGLDTLPARFTPGKATKEILLMHYPLWIEKLPPNRFDLALAGHSHGGQIRVPGWGAILLPRDVGRYEMGMYQTPAGPLYVNPGIGFTFTPWRFCCRPEVTVFEI